MINLFIYLILFLCIFYNLLIFGSNFGDLEMYVEIIYNLRIFITR